jgi:transcriptional regulator with XRE-family HTH domain
MIVEHLKRVFADRSRSNTSYSLRAFAKSLDLDSSTLSAILNGKRPVTLKMARKLIEGLGITDPKEAQMLLLATLTGESDDVEIPYTELAMEAAEAIASWQHFAILSLLELKTFKASPKNISARLNIQIVIVLDCLARLERLGLVEKREGHVWAVVRKDMATPVDIPSKAIREGNRQYIMKSLESLENDTVDLREISGVTLAVSKARLKDAKKLIRDFQMRLATFMESGHKTAVYRFNVQLFPLSKESN